MATKDEIKEIKKIQSEDNLPKDEERIVPLIKNMDQFKIAIPKKFADLLKLDKTKHKAK